MRKYPMLLLAAGALMPQDAWAAILTADNEAQLCIASIDAKRTVDKDALAYSIVTDAGAGLYLARIIHAI